MVVVFPEKYPSSNLIYRLLEKLFDEYDWLRYLHNFISLHVKIFKRYILPNWNEKKLEIL